MSHTLDQLLSQRAAHALRSTASYLGVRLQSATTRSAWLDAILLFWRNPANHQPLVQRLPAPARHALQRLLEAGDGGLPASLFWPTYGAIRRHDLTSTPQTPAEALYLSGLLHAREPVPIQNARRLLVAQELAEALGWGAGQLRADSSIVEEGVAPTPPPPLHDMGQLLAFAQATSLQTMRLLHGRWLPRGALLALNGRLHTPQAVRHLTSHKRSGWLRQLCFLATAAGLLEGVTLTPRAWLWLDQPPDQQLRSLWQSWLAAPQELRRAWAEPDAHVAPPWPRPLVQALRQLPSVFTPAQLVNRMLGVEIHLDAFFVAHWASLTDLDELAQRVLRETLLPLGVVGEQEGEGAEEDALFGVTALGHWLFAEEDTGSASWRWSSAAEAATLMPVAEDEDTVWEVQLTAQASPHCHVALAAYSHYRPRIERDEGGPTHHLYRLCRDSVAAAAAAGHGRAALFAILPQMQTPLPPGLVEALHTWHDHGSWLHLETLTVLRTATAQQMASLHEVGLPRHLLGEVLSPTAVVVQGALEEVMHTLRAARLYPQGTQALTTPPEKPMAGELPPLPLHAGQRQGLWLAAQLYGLLGEHLPLPQPLALAVGDNLLAHATTAERAAAQSMLALLHERLLRLLDQQPFTPPPAPADPVRWLALIAEAIAQGETLEMVYVSAGRNVTTTRRIDPYFVADETGGLYLYAYCHSAQADRKFKLERVLAMAKSAGS